MMIKLTITAILLASANIDTALAGMDERLNLFPSGSSVLCIEEKATGFDWKNQSWSQTNYKPAAKFVIRKLDPATYKDSDTRLSSETLFMCDAPEVSSIPRTLPKNKKFTGFIEACYEIKNMGEKAIPLSARTCSEYWKEGRLDTVSCREHFSPTYFQPDGAYIKYPWHQNIRKDVDKKDSLVLSVGSCSKIN